MRRVLAGLAVAVLVLVRAQGHASTQEIPPLDWFFQAASPDDRVARDALERLAAAWKNAYTPMILDMARLMRPAPRVRVGVAEDRALASDDEPERGTGGRELDSLATETSVSPNRESIIRSRLVRFLEQQTGKRFDDRLVGWRAWMWGLPYDPHPEYARFKGNVYSQIDPRMARFFPPGVKSTIRLDEVDWGGVKVNGIPPLYYPKTVAAADASYLRDGHVVFGLVVNGAARAYPKRILAWHEMARDKLGGVDLHVVYCTLCGTVIPYESVAGGRTWRLGTSGLLYRSNKLMFDEETGSLWSTLEGRPVIGELAERDLVLNARAVVTTTWGEWRSEHPETTVLSLDTGHQRDYSEGAAYRDYFGSDALYFQVSNVDKRLKNKAEILALQVRPPAGGETQPVALLAEFLKRNPIYHFEVQGRRLLAVTSRQGANRIYELGGHAVAFASRPHAGRELLDTDGKSWHATEEHLVREDDPTMRLPRVQAHRAFWFGWFAQFPNTLLIQ